ncbi:MAG: c-type cytochrome [Bacteroidetes bacterium]|nr:c-type cytochrome [Bacteroidota bacterium]
MNKTAIFYGVLVTVIVLALIISSDLYKLPETKPMYADFVTEQILNPDTTNTYGEDLRVLHGIHSRAQLMDVMNGFTEALGVQCAFCHNINDFASDEKPTKRMARLMIRMVTNIDTHYINQPNWEKVTCFTCHRGKSIPKLVLNK